MREEEDRQKQKIMNAAGMYIDEDQAPIAGSSNNNRSSSTTNTNKDNGSNTGSGSGVAVKSGLAGREQPKNQQPRGEHMSGPPGSPPSRREGGLTDAANASQIEGDGAVVDGGHNDASPGAASTTKTNQVFPGRERKNGGNADGEGGSYSGEVHGLDIENDVRKRVLDLVRAGWFAF